MKSNLKLWYPFTVHQTFRTEIMWKVWTRRGRSQSTILYACLSARGSPPLKKARSHCHYILYIVCLRRWLSQVFLRAMSQININLWMFGDWTGGSRVCKGQLLEHWEERILIMLHWQYCSPFNIWPSLHKPKYQLLKLILHLNLTPTLSLKST